MTFNTMVDFSRVARQLREAPFDSDGQWEGQPVRGNLKRKGSRTPIPQGRLERPDNDNSQGGLGFWAEKVITQHVLPRFKEGTYKNVDVSQGNFGTKTDIYQDNGGDPSENIAFSVKSKIDNNHPQKVHQTGINSQGTGSKLLTNRMSKNARSALNWYLGNGTDGEFHNAGEIREKHPEIYKELKDFLDEHKIDIFNNLVRRQGKGGFANSVPYKTFDPRMIDSLISHRVTGENLSGPIDIRNFEGNVTPENFKNLNWFDDGERFFLGENENASTDERMLDIWPIDEKGSKWSNREGDGGPRRGQRGFVEGLREAGLPEPGQFKATMATNPEFLEKYFPKVAEFMLDDDGQSLGLDDIFEKIQDKAQEPQFADGTPNEPIPSPGKTFDDFMQDDNGGSTMPVPDDNFLKLLNPETVESLRDAIMDMTYGIEAKDEGRAQQLLKFWTGQSKLSDSGMQNPDETINRIIRQAMGFDSDD